MVQFVINPLTIPHIRSGREQAATTGKALEGVNFIAAYSGDSTRAADVSTLP